MLTAATTVLADRMPDTPAFLDDLTPESGLGESAAAGASHRLI